MALKLGELVTILRTDNKPMEQGLGQAESGFQKFAGKLKAGAAIAATAIAAALGKGIAQALELDAARAKLTAQVGDPVLAAQLGEVAGKVYGRGFTDSAGEAMQAAQAVVSSHLARVDDAGAIEAMTVKVQAYATAWGTDVSEAARYASSLLGSGLAKNATHAMDLITAASQRVPAALRQDVLDASDEYAQFFRSLGFSGEQAFGLLVEASEKGTYGIDKAGDAIKEFTFLATDMSTSTTDAYKAIGLDAGKMSNDILAGGAKSQEAFQKIVAGLQSIKDPTEQANTAIAFFGTPLEDLNKSDIPEFLRNMASVGDGLGDVSGAADRAGEALEQSASQKLKAFKAQSLTALTNVGAGIIDVIQRIANNPDVKDFMGKARRALDEKVLPALRRFQAWVKDKIMPVLMEIRSNYIAKLQGALDDLQTKVDENRDELIAFGNAIKKAAEWIVANVLPVLYDLYTNYLTRLIAGVGHVIGAISRWVRIFRSLKSGATDAINSVSSKIDWVVGKVSGMKSRISSAASGMWSGISSAFKSAMNWVIGKWNGLSFSIPSISIPGLGSIGGGTVSTPNIPYLAQGGIVPATAGGRLAVVGEGGEDEAVAPLSKLAGMIRDAVAAAGGDQGDTHVYVTIDGEQLEGRIERVVKTKDRRTRRQASSYVGGPAWT